ncbi:MAG: helix-turn-helix transcriptional regulator [Myxococcales bacterium]|nr:helix-turn-helix transcriptional regulator [Myxococcales bacterium]
MPTVEPEELRARVAQRIRELAKRKGLALTRLADEAEVSRAHLWTILNGESAASIDFLAKLAKVLAVDPDELVRRHRKPRSPS